MMIKRLLFLLFVVSVALVCGQSTKSKDKSAADSGIVLVDVDSAGKVTSAKMVKSTGVREYDEAALRKFRQWRFKPPTAAHVKIPVTFTSAGESY
jgi:TonB family protein